MTRKAIRWRAALAAAALALAGPAAPVRAGDDLLGAPGRQVTGGGDTLLALARAHDLGFVELLAANPGVDPWLPGAGRALVLPTAHLVPRAPRRGIVINLADQRLYFFPAGGAPVSYPAGIGRQGWETPELETRVVARRAAPTWCPPPSIRAEKADLPAVVPAGPANPLGDFALDLAPGPQGGSYVIHGTNRPMGVGRRVSHGCIRLYPEDIAALFPRVAVGTPVRIVDQPVKLGRRGAMLYLEVHPTQAQADAIEAGRPPPPVPAPADLAARVAGAAGPDLDRVDWAAVKRVVQERRGLPVAILR